MPILCVGWHPYTSQRLKRGAGPCVARCEKAPALICAGAATTARSAGRFQGQPPALFRRAQNAIIAILIQKDKNAGDLRLSPDAISKMEDFQHDK